MGEIKGKYRKYPDYSPDADARAAVGVKKLERSQIKSLIFIGVIWMLMIVWAAIYMVMSKNIYFWDSSTYWDISRDIASGRLKCGIGDIYKSISELDYNYVAALPGVLWTKIFGGSRTSYILGLVNMYLMPAVCMVYALAKKLSKGEKLAVLMTVAAVPALIFMTLIGFTDVGGMFPCLLVMYLYFTRSEKRIEPLRYVAIGVLLVFVMLWRRWFAFFSVSFVTAMLAEAIIFRKNIVPAIITGLTSALILMFGFRDFVFGKLLADYGNLYSGYKFAASTDVKLVMRYFGLLNLLVLVAGSIAAGVIKKEKRTVFLWAQILICFVMFISTQTHGQQHLLLYVPSLITMALILIRYINEVRLLLAVMLLSAASIINVNIPRTQPNSISEIKHYALIPDFSMRPIVRSDTDDILALKTKLDGVIEEGASLGVLASSFKLNDAILMNVKPSLGMKETRENYIVGLPQVDSRDKDCYWYYNVNYMLVAFPAQTHLSPENQRIVTEAVRSFEVNADFATAYDEIPEFATQLNGMDIRLYKRNREVHKADMVMFEQRLK